MTKRLTTNLKQVLATLLTVAALFAGQNAWAQTQSFPTSSGGSGTSSNPYLIKTTADLNALANDVNSGTTYSYKYFKLDNDIDFQPTTAWNDTTSTENNFTAIGNNSHYFQGIFNGDGHTISGIRIYKPSDSYQGLFGEVGGFNGSIQKVTLADARITGKTYVGGMVGYNNVKVQNCHVTASVAIYAVVSQATMHGGIAGMNYGTVSGCTSAATVSVAYGLTECNTYGGIVGMIISGTVSNCLAICATVDGNNYAGAIVGSGTSNLTTNYYRNCTVNGNTTNVGVGKNNSSEDVEGARGIGILTTTTGVTATGETDGTVVIDNTTYHYGGQTISLTYEIPTGYVFNGFTVTTANGSTIEVTESGGIYTFTMPAEDVTVTGPIITWASLQATLNDASTDEENPTLITLYNDVVAASTDSRLLVTYNKHVIIDLNGYAIDRHLSEPALNGEVIYVRAYYSNTQGAGHLTIRDSSNPSTGRITGGYALTVCGGVQVAGFFTLESGSICGNKTSNRAAGVYINNTSAGGTFTMTGGSITNNTSYSNSNVASTIEMYSTGTTFNMSGGTISGNHGGQWAIEIKRNFNLSGTYDISGNTKNDNTAACDIYCSNNSRITITDPISPVHPSTVATSQTILTNGWSTHMGSTAIATCFTPFESNKALVVADGEVCYGTLEQIYWQASNHSGNSAETAYIITLPEGLQLLSTEVNEGNNFSGKYFKLGDDIDMSGVTDFQPIGNDTNPFSGHFNGNGKTISHLQINASSYAGLFGKIDGGSVSNLTLYGASINITKKHAGGIAGQISSGTIENCHVVGTTITCTSNDIDLWGAIVGTYVNNSTLTGNTYHSTLIKKVSTDSYCFAFNIGAGIHNGDINGATLDATQLFVDASRTDLGTLLDAYARPVRYTNNGSVPNLDNLTATVRGEVTVPSGITFKAPTVNIATGSSLTLADGAYLVCNNAVEATVQKNIEPYTVASGFGRTDGWYFIASPVANAFTPNQVMTSNTYDLYRLNPTSERWENYKNTAEHADFTALVNGTGYLYANSGSNNQGVTLAFTGNTKPYDATYSIPLTEGFNLVGNPYTFDAYVNRPYYKMNAARTAVEQEDGGRIAPCTGVVVDYEDGTSVTFTDAPIESLPSNGNLNIAVAQQVVNRDGSSTETLDKAIVSFNEGSQLGKFYFGTQNANIYIPKDGKEYAIAFSEGQGEMPINFKANEDGEYTITVNPENVEMSYLHLIDNMTGADVDLLTPPACGHPLSEGDYTFTARTTDYESRFKLVFVSSIGEDDNDDNAPFAFFSNGNIIITADADDATLQVIDVMGRVVASVGGHTRCVPTAGMTAGVYVLRLVNGNDVKTQKVVIE